MSQTLEKAIADRLGQTTSGAPARLKEAIEYALFPGGGRIRPRLCLEVFNALGGVETPLAIASAVAIEMIHCASLVHDDMPCFDNAPLRRGKPSVHRAFGEDIALLVGDALIIGAMETLATAETSSPRKLTDLICVLSRAAGAAQGLVAGQAWELEPSAKLATIHQAKTAALFEAAAVIGALASGQRDHHPWRTIGRKIGGAYQIADDLLDQFGDPRTAGKLVHQDVTNDRQNAGDAYSIVGALFRLDTLIEDAIVLVPSGPGNQRLTKLLAFIGARLCPPRLRASIATATESNDVRRIAQDEIMAV